MERFANYIYHGKNINNLGDHAQIMTIDYLYSTIGVKKQDIIYIDIDELSTYDGPPVKLPVSMPLINHCEHGISGMFSNKITPVFLGFTTPRDSLEPAEVSYLKRFTPIGCRDEKAYDLMQKYNIDSYLGGCLTISLPERKSNPEKQNKIFIVDPPEDLKEYIPQETLANAIWDTHIYYGSLDNPTQKAEEQYKKYRDEAKLIITGLLHAAIPCTAYGIPVILARKYLSYRFAWVEALLPIYTAENYSEIDWNPVPLRLDEHKNLIQKLFEKRMRGDNCSNEIEQVHNFYISREKHNYVSDVFITIQEFIDSTWVDFNKEYNYAVWGLTQMAEITVDYISKRYPNAHLTHVYDKRTGLLFRGRSAISPENISLYPDETVFVTTVSAAHSAENYFKQINKPPNLYNILRIIR